MHLGNIECRLEGIYNRLSFKILLAESYLLWLSTVYVNQMTLNGKLRKTVGGQTGGQPKICGWRGPPSLPPLESPLPAIIIEVFTRSETDGTRFSKFPCKRIPSDGEAVGYPRLIFLVWKNGIFCYYCKRFSAGYPLAQHSISLLSAGTTLVTPFWSGRYLAREEVINVGCSLILWFIGFNGVVRWSLCWRGLGVNLSGLAFVTSPISIITPWFTLSKISTHHWVGSHKSVSNRAPHFLRPALVGTVPV